MSGGSYDYLCFHTDNLPARRAQLHEMAERLEGLPYAAGAAAQTRRVIRLLAATETLAASLAEDVWHAVEWWDSGDYGEHQVMQACSDYRAPNLVAPEGDVVAPNPDVLYRLIDVGAGVYELHAVNGVGGRDG